MHISTLDLSVDQYLGQCVAPSTHSASATACRRYSAFCQQFRLSLLFPLEEETLCCFVAHLSQQGLKHRSIKSYLSGLRFTQIQHALGSPSFSSMHRLEYVLVGIKRSQALAGSTQKPRLPITPPILKNLRRSWFRKENHQNPVMLWTAATTGFFGLLQAGEFTVPSSSAYDPQVHLSLADVLVDSHSSSSQICLASNKAKLTLSG